MTIDNITPSSCYDHLQKIMNAQMFLKSGACPKHLESDLQEHILDDIEQLSTMLLVIEEQTRAPAAREAQPMLEVG